MEAWITQTLGGYGLAGAVIAGLVYAVRSLYLRNSEIIDREHQRVVDGIKADMDQAQALRGLTEMVKGLADIIRDRGRV